MRSLPSSTGRSGLTGAALLLLGAAALAGLAGPAGATRGVENYPRIAQYVCSVGTMTPAQLDTLAWFDLVLLRDSPHTVSAVRQRNPDVELFYNWMPQNIVKWNENATWWYPDTTWSIGKLCLFYAKQNDWYLRDIHGNRIPEADGYAANWTRYCPKGTYGSSKGLNYVEWLVQVVMPRLITSGTIWPKWGPGSAAYNGLDLEILVDCVGSFGWQTYAQADPDRDGIAEGVYHSCESGGDADSLSILYREMNELFGEEVARLQNEGVLVILNTATKRMMPEWRTEVTGIKIERWCSYLWNPWVDWWEGFYGVMSYDHTEMLGPGYRWAEDMVGYHGTDEIEGWDHTLLQVIPAPNAPVAEQARVKRWGLGTSLLGDGFFNYTPDECGLWWQPEFEWDFGQPLGPYGRDTYTGSPPDTLYTRIFSRGFVEVNPHPRAVNSVPARDSRFGFWQTVSNLTASTEGSDRVRVAWTAPDQTWSPIDWAELRYAPFPISAANWNNATAWSGNPITAAPGAGVSIVVTGLAANTTYHFALKHRVYGRLEPGTSNVAVATTSTGVQDLSPPAAISDVRSTARGQSWIDLAWTAPAEESPPGRATAYRIRYRLGGAITSESEWSAATPASGSIPAPGNPGTPEEFRLYALQPGVTYGVAVRAVDAAGNLGPLSNPFSVSTLSPPPPPSDTTPPAAIADLRLHDRGERWIELAWTAPGDDGSSGTALSYLIRALPGRAIGTEADWAAGFAPPDAPPTPLPAGQTQFFRFEGLPADSLHGFCVRARDDAGLTGGLSNPFTARTNAPYVPPPPPPQRPPAPVDDLMVTAVDSTQATLVWTAPDDGEGGSCTQYRLAVLAGDSLLSVADLARCSIRILPSPPAAPGSIETWTLLDLEPATLYGAAVFGFDAAMVAGEMGPAVHFHTLSPPEDPPPLPVDPDTLAPEAITDLRVLEAGEDWIVLAWTAPPDRYEEIATRADADPRVERYQVRRLAEEAIDHESRWEAAIEIDATTVIPSEPGKTDTLRVVALAFGQHGFAVRAEDDSGNLAPLSNPLLAETASPPPPPPDMTPPSPAADLRLLWARPHDVEIAWSLEAGGDPTDLARWRVGVLTDLAIAGEEAWSRSDTTREVEVAPDGAEGPWSLVVLGLEAQRTYGIAVRAVDPAGHRSVLPLTPLVVETPAEPDTLPPQRITDLGRLAAGPDWVDLEWTAPADSTTGVAVTGYAVAHLEGRLILSAEDWSRAAVDTAAIAFPVPPGEVEATRVHDLAPSTPYGFAVRARDAAGLFGPISNSILLTTEPLAPPPDPPDTTDTPDPPPAAVAGLLVSDRGDTWARLEWVATGEDSLEGVATIYDLRMSFDAPISDEALWEASTPIPAEVTPRPAGETMSARWDGLVPASEGWLAVRASDAAGQWSPLAASVRLEPFVSDPPPPAQDPPAVTVLEVLAAGTNSVTMRLEHPAVPADAPVPARYETRLSRAAIADSNWNLATEVESPEPGAPGDSVEWVIEDLQQATDYHLAVRSVAADGRVSPLSPLRSFRTDTEDLAPPDPPANLAASWSQDGSRLELRWEPSADPRVSGYRLYAQGAPGGWFRLTETLIPTAVWELDRPDPATVRRVSVRAETRGGAESQLSAPLELYAETWEVEGPFPHPVADGCRFRVTVPADFPPQAVLRLEILALDGGRVARLFEAAVRPGTVIEASWDRRNSAGGLAGPGLHYLLCTGGGRRLLRPIYLSP